ncbi:MAG: hypothetical protein ACYC56_11530 [Candidatus Aquicultor sp.]
MRNATVRVNKGSFEDPAKARGDDEEKLTIFRRVRDEIKAFVQILPGALYE